jgi:hypothetical protein
LGMTSTPLSFPTCAAIPNHRRNPLRLHRRPPPQGGRRTASGTEGDVKYPPQRRRQPHGVPEAPRPSLGRWQ